MESSTPAEPRLAATVILLRDEPFEVLMVRRHAAAVFGSALVFPGGTVDAEDYAEDWLELVDGAEGLDPVARAIRIAGIRETFEETSLLIAHTPDGRAVRQTTATDASFLEVVHGSGGRLALGDIHPYSNWITPERLPRRWDTWFLLARAPEGQVHVPDDAGYPVREHPVP